MLPGADLFDSLYRKQVGNFDEHELEVVRGGVGFPRHAFTTPAPCPISYLALLIGCLLKYRLYSASKLSFVVSFRIFAALLSR